MDARPAPQVIAHRGASADRHENTLDAFRVALAQGADAIELDVHATADGAVVVHHDPVVRIRCRPADRPLPVIGKSTMAALRAVQLPDGSVIPTLEEVCALVGSRAALHVEIKSAGLERAVPAVLARHPAVQAAVHSFDHRVPAAIQRATGLPVGILLSSYLLDPVHAAHQVGARDVWVAEALIDGALVETLHAAGLRCVAWTVDDPVRATALARLGVDGLCTNRPAALRAAVASG
jgi:glycerophosphoryl diester phosphodiesterase